MQFSNNDFNIIISDTSCLSAFYDGGYLNIFNEIYSNKVTITPGVKNEFLVKEGRKLPDWIEI
jgi:predicted nucleic acid-binding protein